MFVTVVTPKTLLNRSSGLRQRILVSSFWVIAAQATYRGMLMLSMMLVARILGKEEYGQLGIIQSSLIMFEAIAALGMGVTTTKHIAEYRNTDKNKVAKIIKFTKVTTFVTAVSFGAVIYLIAPWLSANVLGSAALTDYIRVSALMLFFTNFAAARSSILIGFEAYSSMAVVNGLTGCVTILLIPSGAYLYGIEGALWGLVTVSAVHALMNSFLSIRITRKEGVPRAATLTRDEWGLLWHFSLPAVMSSILYAPVNWIGGAYLVRTAGYGEMGLFSAVNQWFSLLLFVPGVITNVFLPVFADQGGRGREHVLGGLLVKALKVTIVVSLPLVTAVTIFSPWIMRLYGNGYSDAAKMLVVIALAALLASTQNILSNALATMNRMWIRLISNIVWAMIYLISVFVFIELGFKAMGLCLAILLAHFMKLAFSGVMVRRYVLIAGRISANSTVQTG